MDRLGSLGDDACFAFVNAGTRSPSREGVTGGDFRLAQTPARIANEYLGYGVIRGEAIENIATSLQLPKTGPVSGEGRFELLGGKEIYIKRGLEHTRSVESLPEGEVHPPDLATKGKDGRLGFLTQLEELDGVHDETA